MIIRTLMVAVALIGLGAFAVACNDDGGTLTLEEYFAKIVEIDDEQQTKSDELDEEFDALGDDASVDEVADLFEEQVALLRDFASDLDDLEPPDEVADPHEQAVRAFNALPDQFEALLDDFRAADTVEEAFATFGEADLGEFEDATAACLELEQIAADNNIEVDLDCDDNEE